MSQSKRFTLALLISVVTLSIQLAPAMAGEEAEAIERGRRALRDSADYPWYNAQTDDLRPVKLADEQPLRRSSDWVWRRSTQTQQPRNSWQFGSWQTIWQLVQYLVWIAFVVIFVLLGYYWMKTLITQERSRSEAWEDDEARRQHESDAIEHLPFQVDPPETDLWEAARRQHEAGNHRNAIIYLFGYQLVQLDRHNHIQLAKGKTNRQYLHELKNRPRLRELVTQTMLLFEDVFFGNYPLERVGFERCWQQIDEFEQLLAPTAQKQISNT